MSGPAAHQGQGPSLGQEIACQQEREDCEEQLTGADSQVPWGGTMSLGSFVVRLCGRWTEKGARGSRKLWRSRTGSQPGLRGPQVKMKFEIGLGWIGGRSQASNHL